MYSNSNNQNIYTKNEHSAGDENYCFNFRILKNLNNLKSFVYFGYLPFLNIIDRIVLAVGICGSLQEKKKTYDSP